MGRPTSRTAVGTGRVGGGSAAEVVLAYPDAIAQCSASSLMPVPYAVRGGYRAAFTRGVLESAWTAGYEGSGPTTLTEYTDEGAREITLRESQGYAAVIDHVIDCLRGEAVSRIDASSVLDALQLTVDVHNALTARRAAVPPAGDERTPS